MIGCSGCSRKPPTHGVEFLVEIHSNRINDADYRQTVYALRGRLYTFAPFFETTARNRVRILFPPLSEADRERVRNQITNSTVLEFRLVRSASDDLVKNDVVPPGWELLKQQRPMPGVVRTTETFVVNEEPAGGLTSRAFQSAAVARDNLGRPEIIFHLNPRGTRIFADITRTNIGQRLAIVLNGEVITAPRIQSAIEQGSGVIQGDFNESEARELVSLLEYPLIAPVTIVEERSF